MKKQAALLLFLTSDVLLKASGLRGKSVDIYRIPYSTLPKSQ
jgi:hypothetical protein